MARGLRAIFLCAFILEPAYWIDYSVVGWDDDDMALVHQRDVRGIQRNPSSLLLCQQRCPCCGTDAAVHGETIGGLKLFDRLQRRGAEASVHADVVSFVL